MPDVGFVNGQLKNVVGATDMADATTLQQIRSVNGLIVNGEPKTGTSLVLAQATTNAQGVATFSLTHPDGNAIFATEVYTNWARIQVVNGTSLYKFSNHTLSQDRKTFSVTVAVQVLPVALQFNVASGVVVALEMRGK